jgi:6-phosphogluconolactonase
MSGSRSGPGSAGGEGSVLRPPNGELRVVDDVPTAFAELVAEEARAAAGRGDGRFRMALSGGDTARACYEQLARHDLEWERIEFFLGDERCVSPDDAAANQRLVREALASRVEGLGAFHPMSCDRAGDYASLLERQPALDLIHLGLGPDGHTASLFPDSIGLDAPEDELVVHNEDPSGRNPYERLSLTFSAIARFSVAVFTVAGPKKRDALSRVLEGEDLPAARVGDLGHGSVIWLCDREALPDGLGSIG